MCIRDRFSISQYNPINSSPTISGTGAVSIPPAAFRLRNKRVKSASSPLSYPAASLRSRKFRRANEFSRLHPFPRRFRDAGRGIALLPRPSYRPAPAPEAPRSSPARCLRRKAGPVQATAPLSASPPGRSSAGSVRAPPRHVTLILRRSPLSAEPVRPACFSFARRAQRSARYRRSRTPTSGIARRLFPLFPHMPAETGWGILKPDGT